MMSSKKESWWDPNITTFLNSEITILPSGLGGRDKEDDLNSLERGGAGIHSLNENDLTIKLQSISTIGRLYANWYNLHVELIPTLSSHVCDNSSQIQGEYDHQSIHRNTVSCLKQIQHLTLTGLFSWYNHQKLSKNSFLDNNHSNTLDVKNYYKLKIYAKSANFCFPSGHPNDIWDLINTQKTSLLNKVTV